MGDGCHSSIVQEINEIRIDCSSELARSSDVDSNLPTPAHLQSSRPISVSREHRIALLSTVETFCSLKQISALLQSRHLVIRGFLLLAETLFGLLFSDESCHCS